MLCEEIEKYDRKGDLSMSDLEKVHKLTDTLKNIHKIEALGEGESYRNGMSSRTYVRGYYRSNDRGGYDGGSYDGRSYDSYDRNSYRRSYDAYDSYGDTVEQLRSLIAHVDDKDKPVIQNAIRQIEKG
jgi:hypothetical protein